MKGNYCERKLFFSREKNRRESLFEKPKINIDFENRRPES